MSGIFWQEFALSVRASEAEFLSGDARQFSGSRSPRVDEGSVPTEPQYRSDRELSINADEASANAKKIAGKAMLTKTRLRTCAKSAPIKNSTSPTTAALPMRR
jgi:hypothetical protein